jgi:hypothetical protein
MIFSKRGRTCKAYQGKVSIDTPYRLLGTYYLYFTKGFLAMDQGEEKLPRITRMTRILYLFFKSVKSVAAFFRFDVLLMLYEWFFGNGTRVGKAATDDTDDTDFISIF